MSNELQKENVNMYCGKCGAVIPDGKKFCADCGEPVAPAAAGRTGRMSKEQREALTAELRQEKATFQRGILGFFVTNMLVILIANCISAAEALTVDRPLGEMSSPPAVFAALTRAFSTVFKCSLFGSGMLVFVMILDVIFIFICLASIEKKQDRLDADSK